MIYAADHADALIATQCLRAAADGVALIVGADIDLPVLSLSDSERNERILWCKSLLPTASELVGLSDLLAAVKGALGSCAPTTARCRRACAQRT